MSKHRRAAKVDNNQDEIVKQLRSIPGVSVELGHDDILVGYKGKTYWYELKQENKVSRVTGEVWESDIKPSQKKLRDKFPGHYRIVWNIQQILEDLCLA